MKFDIGGNIDSEIYEAFRINRNIVLKELLQLLEEKHIAINLKELSVHIFIRDDTPVEPIHVNYINRQKRAETECIIDFDEFQKANDHEKQELIEKTVTDSIVVLHNNKKITAEDFAQLTNWLDSKK
ncbi:Imm44 family immunity protein [Dysgonomonas sp. 25]|uniref:Imm44 family immunity protein n=1 Tax=Dysgonomonas sp. 25 TaxID=2302933 RepID=UPI0013D8265D|nr:Imm44 family immunity protein [Dysgonomonas sp. 25]NDV68299.1 hypothetical protein [Dysgonomonas sp. 25]